MTQLGIEVNETELHPGTERSLHRVLKERTRQVTLGYTAEHDAEHDAAAWAYYIRRELEAIGRDSQPDERSYRVFDKVGAMALAALEALPEHSKLRAARLKAEEDAMVEQSNEMARKRAEQQRTRQQSAEAEDTERRRQVSELEAAKQRIASLEGEVASLKAKGSNDTSRRRTKRG